MWAVVIIASAVLIAAAVLFVPMTKWGMQKLYEPLVKKLVGGDPRCRIDRESRTMIVLTLETEDGTTVFRLRQTPVHLVVRWTNESPITGKRALEWTFFKFKPQRAVFDRIYDDLLVAHRKMMRS